MMSRLEQIKSKPFHPPTEQRGAESERVGNVPQGITYFEWLVGQALAGACASDISADKAGQFAVKAAEAAIAYQV